MNVAEVATLLEVDPSTVRRWIASGLLPARRIGARKWQIARADALALQLPPGAVPPPPADLTTAIAVLADRLRELHQPWAPGQSRMDAMASMLATIAAAVDVARAAGHDVGKG